MKTLLDKAINLKQSISHPRDTKTALDFILTQVESIKGDLDLDKIFSTIGERLISLNNNTFLITLFTPNKEHVIIRHLSLRKEIVNIVNKIFQKKIIRKKIPLSKLPEYQKLIKEKKAFFYKDRHKSILNKFPLLKNFLKNSWQTNSILAPIILNKKIIGGIEFLSPDLKKEDQEIFNNFSRDLVKSIANVILFHEIKASEKKYKELWDKAPVAYHTLDKSGFIKDVNETEVKMLGYSKYEMIGKSIFQFIVPEERADAKKTLELKLAGKELSKKKERIFLKKDGSKIYTTINFTLDYDDQNNIIGLRTTVVDISKSRQAKEELQRNYDIQNVINTILNLSHKEIDLEKILDQALNKLLEIPWLAFEKKGGIFLAEKNPNVLLMKVQNGLPETLQHKCAVVPFGKCVCGQAALKKKIQFINKVYHSHEVDYKGILPHGHYCVPILFSEKLLGVINIYVKEGHQSKPEEEEFLIAFANALAGIIQRKRTEDALKKSEEKFRRFFETNAEYCYIISARGKIIDVNCSALKALGYKKEELIGKPVLKTIYAPSSLEKSEKLFAKWKKTGKLRDEELNIITKKGKEITILLNVDTIKDTQGNSMHSISVQRDLTARKKAEEALRQSKEKYRKLVDNAEDGVFILNPQGYYTFTNKAFFKIYGYNESDLVKTHFSKIIHPDDFELVSKHFKDRLVGNEAPTSYSLRIISKSGKVKYISFSGSVIKEGNKSIGVQGFVRDITEQKRAEEEIRKLHEFNKRILDNAPVSIIIIDKKGIITSTNKFINNISTSENYIGKNIYTLPFFKREKLVDKYKKLLQTGKTFSKANCRTTNKEGQIKYLNIIAVPLNNLKGEIEGVISMAIDNTEAILTKEKIEKLNEELEKKVIQRTWQLDLANKELNKALDLKLKFIADASHELRTPLTIIKGNLDLAINKEKKINNQTSEVYTLMNKEIKRMTGILSDLTMLTNADSYTEKLSYEKINLESIIKAVEQSLRVLAKQKNIKLSYQKHAKTLNIEGDEAKIEKLLLNIVRNAIKYTNEGGWVKIKAEKDEVMARIIVEDNGIGIPKEDLPFIFERFYRVAKSRSRKEGGTGLGLSISRWIARIHNGYINVESELGRGSKFIINIPCSNNNQKINTRLF
ncbi:MAG: PAS domain S-box protein [Patescibacteria group bacterium]